MINYYWILSGDLYFVACNHFNLHSFRCISFHLIQLYTHKVKIVLLHFGLNSILYNSCIMSLIEFGQQLEIYSCYYWHSMNLPTPSFDHYFEISIILSNAQGLTFDSICHFIEAQKIFDCLNKYSALSMTIAIGSHSLSNFFQAW